jgi:hypothetical protein
MQIVVKLNKCLYYIYFILTNIHFHILANILLGVGTLNGIAGALPGKEGGIQVLVSLAPSSQKAESFLRTHWAGKAG